MLLTSCVLGLVRTSAVHKSLLLSLLLDVCVVDSDDIMCDGIGSTHKSLLYQGCVFILIGPCFVSILRVIFIFVWG